MCLGFFFGLGGKYRRGKQMTGNKAAYQILIVKLHGVVDVSINT